MAPKLPKALREELALQKMTYAEAIHGCDPTPTHAQLLELLQGWRKLTPQQKAAWDDAARRYNLAGADPAAGN